VFIHGQILTRGCGYCNHKQEFLLPRLHKKVIYLDQFFLSHAFRAEQPEFVEGVNRIGKLAHDQLLVSPISSVHETETFQWRHLKRDALWKFIKTTSRGHRFQPAYKVRVKQIVAAFVGYVERRPPVVTIDRSDVLEHKVDEWDDYFWWGLDIKPENIDQVRASKEEARSGLVELFPIWIKSTKSFEEHQAYEHRVIGEYYINAYLQKARRIVSGDSMAVIDSPIDSAVVETMINGMDPGIAFAARMSKIRSYFNSEHFASVPYEYISTGLITALRAKVKDGAYQNLEKAKSRLGGFLYDSEFISAYAPYCDAMFIDSDMHNLVCTEQLGLERKYDTRFFSKNNWEDFLRYLGEIEQGKNEALTIALKLAYPE
jgi:hypothetical protein